MKKILNFIKENRYILIILGILYAILCYCHFNTFVSNDDLLYSFYRPTNERVTNLIQVLKENIRYYMNTNGRFIVHCIVMTLLIFGKSLWA